MYTYLNQKYGLKSLILEWAASIINGVKTHAREDHDVALFAKILKNECDENFRFVQVHVKKTLSNLVKAMIKDKFQHKTEGDVQRLVEEIKKGKIEDWMWSRIIERMYEVRDQITLQESIKSNALNRAEANQEDVLSPKKLTRNEMNRQSIARKAPVFYSDFEKIILDFQLLQHE